MEIRPYEDRDEPGVVNLWRTVFGYTEPRNDPARALRQKLSHDRDLLLVAVGDGHILGTIMGGYDGHRGWLYSVAVDPAHRRRGIATALVQHMERRLADRGCPKINLQVFPSNAQAVAFYRSLGFAVEERISMGKVLS
jgi:hypothetical protein